MVMFLEILLNLASPVLVDGLVLWNYPRLSPACSMPDFILKEMGVAAAGVALVCSGDLGSFLQLDGYGGNKEAYPPSGAAGYPPPQGYGQACPPPQGYGQPPPPQVFVQTPTPPPPQNNNTNKGCIEGW
ncbi:hypothetical protein Dimus_037667 [Dionaea muscipula]